VPETSLLVVLGCGLVGSWVQFFSFVMDWVGLGQSAGGLSGAGSKKMDPQTTLTQLDVSVSTYSPVVCLTL